MTAAEDTDMAANDTDMAAEDTDMAAEDAEAAAPRSRMSGVLRLLSRLLPRREREAIVGDLLEEAAYRDVSGARRQLWLATECGAIAAGLTVIRVRDWLVVPPVRELAAGLALDGSRALRGGHTGALLRVVIFCGSVGTLLLGVELLVASLMSAAGF